MITFSDKGIDDELVLSLEGRIPSAVAPPTSSQDAENHVTRTRSDVAVSKLAMVELRQLGVRRIRRTWGTNGVFVSRPLLDRMIGSLLGVITRSND
jgi:hypothetical protein